MTRSLRAGSIVAQSGSLVVLLLSGGVAEAQDATRGVVTTLDLKACKILKKHPDGNAWLCPGLAGVPVYVAEGDLRFYVSAGMAPEKRRAASQTLRPFNSIFKGQASRASVEWRAAGTGKARQPYATIRAVLHAERRQAG